MVKQYPHKLYVKSLTTMQYEFYSACRDDSASGDVINGENNIAYTVKSTIYCPKNTDKLLNGNMIKVIGEFNEIRLADEKVIRSTKDYFHTRIWV